MASIAGLVKNMSSVDPSGGMGNKIKVAGRHLVEVKAVRLKPSEQLAATFFIVEFTVIETTALELGPADLQSDAARAGYIPVPVRVGGEYSWAHDVTNRFFGASRLKQFLIAATGVSDENAEALAKESGMDVDAYWVALADQSYADDQPLAGVRVCLETQPAIAKNSEKPFTAHTWSAV